MTDFPATVRAAQLVYSNVEAEHSPTGRRGFQVWLCSPRLREHQREIARRLEDFEWPAPDADANRITERLIFFRLAAGDFVIARTVPLTERDALHRVGRFHAHAVVLIPDEFATVRCDPFAVFDHFPFQDGPAAVIEAGAWKAGTLPDDAPVPVGPPRPSDPAFGHAVRAALPLLAQWLAGPDDPRPVAVAAPPDRVASFLRAALRALPPGLRAAASFDTLSTGQALGQLPFRFAGGYDPTTVRDWPYRRSYRLDIDTGEFPAPPTPPTDPGLDRLAAAWAGDDSLSDDDRDGSYRLHRFLRDPEGAPPPGDISDHAFELVCAAPGVEAGAGRLFRRRLAADVPFPALHPLAEARAREWAGPFCRAALDRLSVPIPRTLLAGWMREQAEQQPLTEPQANDLERWTAELLTQPGDDAAKEDLARLYLIGVRWQSDAGDRLTALRAKPGWDRLLDGWLRDWFYRLSPVAGWVAAPHAAVQLAEGLFAGSERLPALALADTEVHLALPPADGNPPPGFKPLAFAAAFRRTDAKRMGDLLADREDHAFAAWTVAQAQRRGLTFDFALGEVAGQPWPGVTVGLGGPTDPAAVLALLDAFAGSVAARRELLHRGRRAAAKLAARPIIRPDDRLKAVEAAYDRQSWDKVADRLDALDPGEWAQVLLERLADKCRGARTVPVRSGGGLWVGVVLEPFVYPELFAGLYGAVVSAARRHPERTRARVAALLTAVEVK